MKKVLLICTAVITLCAVALADEFPKPYDQHTTKRENVFAFARKPSVRFVQKDRYEIVFAMKGYCDVTVDVVDSGGAVVRHLASGVLGKNAPAPFKKDALTQKLYWNGKDDHLVFLDWLERLVVLKLDYHEGADAKIALE